MVINTGKEKKKDVLEQVRAGKIQRTEKYKCLAITINEERNISRYIEEIKLKCEAVRREIEIVGSKNQQEIESQGCIQKEEIKEIDRTQGKHLKRIFKLPLSATYLRILI